MKKQLSLAFTFCGCFLGAGFVSGQELWQFFGAFGGWGYLGLALAMGLTVLCGWLIFALARRCSIRTMDRLIIPWERAGILRRVIGVIQIIFLLGIFMIMAAGAGALLRTLFGLPRWIGSLALILLVGIAALFGLGGLIRIFDILVPVLVGLTVLIGGTALLRNGLSLPAPEPKNNPLLSNFFFSAVSFVCYNLFSALGVLLPLAHRSEKGWPLGVALGTAVLSLIGLSVLLPIGEYSTAELPMLELAGSLHPALKYLYGLLLLAAMFAAGLTCLTGTLQFTPKPKATLPFCLALCFVGSMLGFGGLIGTVYPFFGYLSLFGIISMLIYFIRSKQHGTEKL
ncbi:MAG: hypothetical protein IJ043_05865 [Clostridia bacterium]|nr:hypothetical protein [Clostridia bacterium]